MSKFLVIAEKPSVAQSYAKNLSAYKREEGYLEGESCIVSWCLGHLAEYARPEEYDPKYEKWQFDDLPILPEVWKLKVSKDKKKQFDVLKGLMNRSDVEYLVNGCDAGREGELIFQRVYDLAGCKKPVKRLWISSMEDTAIREGFQTMKSEEEYKNLCMAAVCRAQADWLIGMNGTRAYTTRYFKRLVVGRVQTPTLAMLAERQERIEHFQKEAFYKVSLTDGKLTVVSENIANEEAADLLAALCNGSTAVVTQMKKERKKSFPPKLYDLTSLQREANRYFGYTAKRTLDMLQELYEEKLVTYPRTDSQYLSDDMEETARNVIAAIMETVFAKMNVMVNPNIKAVLNSKKVTDHHAIIPTVEIARTDLSELPSGERDVLTLLVVRLLCATTQANRFEAVTAMLDCQRYTFTAKGKTILQSGWKEVERIHRMSIRQSETEHRENEDAALPVLKEGQTFETVSASLREGKTSPPKHYTEDTLLSAMETAGAEDMPEDAERKGLGTPATRAATLEKLVSAGFVQRKKKQLIPTEKGKNLIAVLPDNIKSPILTAEWESMLKQVEHGELSATSFMDQIADMSRTLVKEHTTPEERFADLFPSSKGTAHEAVGVCPRCGAPVFEGKKGFFCDNRECSFALWKDNRFFSSKKKSITKSVAAALLKEGRISMSGLYSEKTGKTYDAEVILDDTGGKYVNFKLEFPIKKGRRK